MGIFSKLLEPLSKTITKELDKSASKNASKEASKNLAKPSNNPHEQRQIHKEQRGIYNVTYNGKFSTPIKKDLATLDEALRYAQGNKNKGAKHIKIKHHTDPKQEGYITQQELLNMGKNIREYLAKHKEPFIDKNGARLYEWENEAGERFRLVVNDVLPKASKNIASGSGKSPQLLQPPADDIITFFSSRNLPQGKVFEFKNPKLQDKKHISVRHATTTSASKAQKDNKRLLKRSDDYPLVERTTSTHPHSAQTHEGNRPNGANALSKDNQSNSTKNPAQNQAELPFMRE